MMATPLERQCDVVIVGARCAGASLGAMLARRGMSTIVVDRERMPSDHVLSTHTVHPPGMDVLDELGVGGEVRRLAPASPRLRLAKNDAVVDSTLRDGRADYCPRRGRLDGLLQQAAVEAGAELIDRCRVTGLVEHDGRVRGVRATRGDEAIVINAPLVIGADGRHSTVAGLVKAEEYLAYDAPRGTYWGYWDMPAVWHSERYPFDLYVGNRDGDIRVIFQTDDNKLLIASAPPLEKVKQWRTDPLAALTADLMSDPVTAPLVDGRAPSEPIRGTVSERYFFRQGAGPGWALVGDAGHHKDYVIGDGITEALLQAKSLAPAIASGTDAALTNWWRRRDVAALPLYYFAMQEGRPLAPSTLDQVVFTNVARDPALRARMTGPVEHVISPFDVLPLSTILKWTLAAAVTGKPAVIRDFLASGRRMTEIQKELKKRRALAAIASAPQRRAVPMAP